MMAPASMNRLADLALQVMELDELLRPIAKRPVDITERNWIMLLKQHPHPLDEAGVRTAAETLLDLVIEEYQRCDADA